MTYLEHVEELERRGVVRLDPAGEIRWDSRPGEGCPECGAIDHRLIDLPSGVISRTCDEHGLRWNVE